MSDTDMRVVYAVIGVLCAGLIAGVILGGVSNNSGGGSDNSSGETGIVMQTNSDFQPVTMNDVPQEHRNLIVSQSAQHRTSSYHINVEDEALLDREWRPYERQYSRSINIVNYSHDSGGSEHPHVANKSQVSNSSTIVEFTQYPKSGVTIEQLNNSWELYYKTYQTADENNWFNLSNAHEDNYYAFDYLHYLNVNRFHTDETLNPNEPESLLYRTQDVVTESGEQKSVTRLVGVMYLQNSFEHGEQIGGPLTVWHHHRKAGLTCPGESETQHVLGDGSAVRDKFNATANELVPNGEQLLQESKTCTNEEVYSTKMMHVWFEKRPGGPFASPMVSKSRPPAKYDMMNKTEFISYTLDRYKTVQNNASVK